jgi:hypothetical protein
MSPPSKKDKGKADLPPKNTATREYHEGANDSDDDDDNEDMSQNEDMPVSDSSEADMGVESFSSSEEIGKEERRQSAGEELLNTDLDTFLGAAEVDKKARLEGCSDEERVMRVREFRDRVEREREEREEQEGKEREERENEELDKFRESEGEKRGGA